MTLTDAAAARVAEIMANNEKPVAALKVGVRNGGCAGMSYTMEWASEIGKFDGYQPLAVEIGKFFQSKVVPVSEQETLEIYAFMEAADESKRQGGKPVTLESVLAKARTEAAIKVKTAIAK